ncbi:MAG: hypothetical protein Q7J10_10370 [Methanosarcinaceae archaeon]|nr:hypothetical protein [Methanosarcinaceae archaeon]
MTEIDYIKAKLDYYKLGISIFTTGLFLILIAMYTINIDKPDLYIIGFIGLAITVAVIILTIAYNKEIKLLK